MGECELKWLLACGALVAGEALGLRFECLAPLAPAFAGAGAVALLVAHAAGVGRLRFAAALAAGFVLALQASAARRAVLERTVDFAGGAPVDVVVRVEGAAEERRGRDGARRWAFPGSVGPVRVKAVVPAAPSVPAPRVGETWACAGWMARRPPARPLGRRLFWGSSPARLVAGRGRLAAFAERLRADLSRRVGIGLAHDPASADLNRAILLGERGRIGRTTRDAFVAAGTVHVFAISGLHVMIVAKVLLTLLVVAFVPLRFAGLALLPVLWGYTLLVGSPPSAVRATLMATFYFAAPLFWRRPNGLMAWAFTFLLVYGGDPTRLTDVGCGLSFAVMLALVVWSRAARRAGLGERATAFGVTAVAWAAGVPIAAHVFGRVTPGGLVANLVAVPVAFGSVAGGVLGIFASCVSETLAAHVNNAAALFTRLMAGLSRAVASVPGASFEIAPWPFWECALWYAALALAALFIAVRRKRDRI